jgi:anti-anti-sigma regulatory factor
LTAWNEPLLIIGRPTPHDDVPRLCGRVRTLLLDGDGRVIVCDVGAVTAPDLGVIDVLARLQLTAQRLGGHVRLRDASPELQALLSFVGLSDVFPVRLRVEPGGQAEEREQPGGVEEGVHRDDPAG